MSVQTAVVVFCDIDSPVPIMALPIGGASLGPGLCSLDASGRLVRAANLEGAVGWSPGAVNGGIAQVWASEADYQRWLRWGFDLLEA